MLAVNTNPIHFDAHYAAQTEFGKPLVNSPFILALVTGLSVADISRYAVNLGWDEVRMPAPVFEGDTIYAHDRSAQRARVEVAAAHGHRRSEDDGLQAGWHGRDDVPSEHPRVQTRPRAEGAAANPWRVILRPSEESPCAG